MTGRFYILLLAMLIVGEASAQTARWAVRPIYDDIDLYAVDLFRYHGNGKVGLVDNMGQAIMPIDVDSITVMTEGCALALLRKGARWAIAGIVVQDGLIYTPIEGEYYATRYSFFSEGMLCVADRSGKKGFLNVHGSQAIACQFFEARPFRDGWACVEPKERQVIYINSQYDTNGRRPLTIDFHYGQITFGTTFDNGRALVGYNTDFVFINSKGQKVANYKYNGRLSVNKEDYTLNSGTTADKQSSAIDSGTVNGDITVYWMNNLCGYSIKGKQMLPVQFDKAQPFVNGYAKVTWHGRVGLLKLVGGSFSASLDRKVIEILRDSAIAECNYDFTVPATLDHSSLKVRFDMGDGVMIDANPANVTGNRYRLAFAPIIRSGVDTCRVRAEVYSDNLLVMRDTRPIAVTYPISLNIDKLDVATKRAEENDIQTVYSVIRNLSAMPVTVSITLSATAKGSTSTEKVTIASGDRYRINLALVVKNEEKVDFTVALEVDGKPHSSITKTVVLIPFY